MRIECPACHSELDPSNTQCPVCLRPRKRGEIMTGLAPTRLRPSRRRWILPLACAAAAILTFHYLHATKVSFVAIATPTPAPAALEPAVPTEPLRPTVVMNAPPPPPVAAPAEPQPPPQHAARRPRRQAAPKGWVVTGKIYALLTLKPVAARVVFQDKGTDQAFAATADARGGYKVELPKSADGYDVSLSARGFPGVYLEDMSPSYRNQSRARREEAAIQFAESAVLHVPLQPRRDETNVVYDLALLPP